MIMKFICAKKPLPGVLGIGAVSPSGATNGQRIRINGMKKARIEQCDNGYIVWLEDKKGETAKRLVFENVDLALVYIKKHMVMENNDD